MQRSNVIVAVAGLVCGLSSLALAEDAGLHAISDIKLKGGTAAGSISFAPSPSGVLIKLKLTGLPPGAHAIRVHETGTCDGEFESAGGIFNPFGAVHGLLNPEGPMAGDLPNIFADATGAAEAEFIAPHMQLSADATESLVSEDQRSILIFERPDDHASEDGGAGARIACGVITKK